MIVTVGTQVDLRCMHGHTLLTSPQSVGGGLLQSFGDFCPSVRTYGKGRLRESIHPRIIHASIKAGRVVTLSPAQWCIV